MNKSIILLGFILLVSIGLAQAQEDCTGGVPSVYHNGLYWAWASPCSGGCSYATPSEYDYDQYGWRYVSGDDEWSLRPDKSVFSNGDGDVVICASPYFDPTYNHCDYINDPVYQYDGGHMELWFVNDCDGGPPAQDGDVPEFGIITGIAAIGLAGAALLIYRRKK